MALGKFGETKLVSIIGKENYQIVKDLEILTKSLARGQKVAQGSQTAFITRIIGELGLLFTNPVTGLKIIIGDLAYQKLITTDLGKQLLTQGIKFTGETGKKIQATAPTVGKIGESIYQTGKASEVIEE